MVTLPRVGAQHNLVHISVGDLLRAEVTAGTAAGKAAREYMDSGRLVPNEVPGPQPACNRIAAVPAMSSGWQPAVCIQSRSEQCSLGAAALSSELAALTSPHNLCRWWWTW